MRGFWDYMNQFTELGGMLYIMVALFLIGFTMKTVGNFCYDILLDRLENGTWKNYKWIANLVNRESVQTQDEHDFLAVEIKRTMHNWRCMGIPVEQMQKLGDAIAGIILIFGVYSYLTVSIVLSITLKIWDKILAVDYKHDVILDELHACLLGKEALVEAEKETLETESIQEEPITLVNVEIKKESKVAEQENIEEQAKNIRVIEPGEKKKRNFSKSKEAVFDEIINEFLS
jgi:hypothetical protein